MSRFFKKIKELHSRMLVMLVLLSFIGMAGYSVLLHNHDFNFSHAHDDCVSCQWNQTAKVDKTDSPAITQTALAYVVEYRAWQLELKTVHSGVYSRGHPIYS